MIKRIPTLLLLLGTFQVLAQVPLNQWIDYTDTYYKIKVAEDGLYRIEYDLLQEMGIPTVGAAFQIFHEGKEIPIYVSTEGDMATNDYIEFYGEKNKGTLDQRLYEEEIWQPQPHRSLFSDTAVYFLRWKEGITPLHYQNTSFNLNEAPLAESYFMEEVQVENLDEFYQGEPAFYKGEMFYTASFAKGEGFIGEAVEGRKSVMYEIPLTHPYTQIGVNAEGTARVLGLSNVPDFQNEHHFSLLVNGERFLDRAYDGYDIADYAFSFSSTILIQNNNTLRIDFRSVGDKVDTDVNAITNLSIRYPRRFDFDGAAFYTFQLPNVSDPNIEISNFNSSGDVVLYDVTNAQRFIPDNLTSKLRVWLPLGSANTDNRQLVLVNTSDLENGVRLVEKMEVRNFIDYSQSTFENANLIITNSQVLQSNGDNYLQQYLEHRASFNGGQVNVQPIDIHQLYDQFAWGIDLHPLAIRNFVELLVQEWQTPIQTILLLGNGVRYNLSRTSPAAYRKAILPTWGDIPSDNWMVSDQLGTSTIAVGRIPIREAQDLAHYITKLEVYDESYRSVFCDLDNEWRKKVMLLSGANSQAELFEYNKQLDTYEEYFTQNGFGGIVSRFENVGSTVLPIPKITELVNKGVGIINYMGNSRGDNWNIDFQDIDALNNEGKYPFVIGTTCCSEEAFQATKDPVFSAQLLTEANKGAIAYLGEVGLNDLSILQQWNKQFYEELLSPSNYGKSLGEALQATRRKLVLAGEEASLQQLLQQSITLFGDPLLEVVPRMTPELMIDAEQLHYYDHTGKWLTGSPIKINFDVPFFEIKAVIYNIGKAVNGTYNVEVTRWLPNGTLVPVAQTRADIPTYVDTISIQVPNDQAGQSGTNSFIVFIDSEAEVIEFCESDNSITESLEIYAFCNNPPPLDLGGDTLYFSQGSITLQNQATGNYNYHWSINETSPQIEVTQPGTYSVTITDTLTDCRTSQKVVVSFPVSSQIDLPSQYQLYPNPATDQIHINGIKIAQATLYNIQGKSILQHQWKEGRTHINVQALPKGIYWLEIHHEKGIIHEKIIKQ